MKQVFSIAALVGLLLSFCQPANANVIYQFHGTFVGGPFGGQDFSPSFDVTDAAFAAGSMNFSMTGGGLGCGPNSPPLAQTCTIVGDPSGFGQLTGSSWSPMTSSGFGDQFAIDLIFNHDGTLTGNIIDDGLFQTLQMGGSEYDWSGVFSSDFLQECGQCLVQGYFKANLPEPFTISLFGIGLVGALVVHRRRKKNRGSNLL